ncbi:Ypt/Rab-GAP domain of gyp1p superfamily protein [Hirschfeldia incana]|nr:Ypt/Rab-GAP domain of gyp1p superfamily protein [Hirschfeldia incana]
MTISEEIQRATPCSSSSPSGDHRFEKLRGVRWRINLGILPSSPSSTIDELRRVTADSRRRYAALRRRLLIDPHLPKKGINAPDLTIDNPLSQNPDSTWGRFFRNAELEKTLDQDLSRLYPEHGSYFQSSGCQGMLRRILLLWCLKHPEIGYRQGMHELLAPLLYVLQVDVQYLTEVRSNYEDQFTDLFDELAFQERDSAAYDFDIKKVLDDSMEEEEEEENGHATKKKKKPKRFDELDTETQTAVLLSDAYGAEGELGIVLSDKFLEHDAYSMFDALMYGGTSLGSVSVANFFVYSAPSDSVTGLPPVIEASSALYYLLSLVDASLHSHLVELGVEPQYFALRWLRVLFGREFPLSNLLTVWDEIFSADNSEVERVSSVDDGDVSGFEFRILSSPRGALVAGMAVSMILYLRSSLLATENATSSLKRLLNFPEDVDLCKVIEKAKSLQSLALEINARRDLLPKGSRKPMRGHSLSVDSISLGGSSSPVGRVPESYWEEKWRVMNSAEEEEARKRKASKRQNMVKKSWSERVKLRLARTESDPSDRSGDKPPIRRSLLDDLSKQLGEKDSVSPTNTDTDVERSSTVSGSPSRECEDKSEDHVELPLPVPENESEGKSVVNIFRDRNILSGKFQKLWRFGRHMSGEETSETKEAKPVEPEAKLIEPEVEPVEPEAKPIDLEEEEEKTNSESTLGDGDALKNTGRSMLEHIKVIESVLEQSSPENMAENHRLTVEEALRELRRLGTMLLSEM